MGLRNPSRMTIDPETDVPYAAWVGPDAGSPSATQGPSTYETATQLPRRATMAGRTAWATSRPTATASPTARCAPPTGRATSPAVRRPRRRNGWYDCNNLVNDSTNNTGLVTLPHTTGTGKDAGTAHSNNVWYSRGNPGNGNGCPQFPREQGANNAPNYGGHADPAVPVPDRLRRDGVHRAALPLQGGRGQLRALAEVLGRPLVPATTSATTAPSTRCCSIRRPIRTARQPVYADSFRGSLPWGANYMDSKFGPDGALYVQVYEGFFTTGYNAGLYRFKYTGGADTPGPDPQWKSTATARTVQFSIGASGGVSYEWDFGDGDDGERAPTRRTPTRRPAPTPPS